MRVGVSMVVENKMLRSGKSLGLGFGFLYGFAGGSVRRERRLFCSMEEEAELLGRELVRCRDVRAVTLAARSALERAKVPEAEPNADYIVGSVFGVYSRSGLRRVFGRAVTDVEIAEVDKLCRRRIIYREPVQYLVGNWDFHDLNLLVRAPVLIPRPETEELVELILGTTTENNTSHILDIGTGSGAILLALLNKRKHSSAVAIDISPDAIQ